MLRTLQFNISVPTPYVFLNRFLKAYQADKHVCNFHLIIVYKALIAQCFSNIERVQIGVVPLWAIFFFTRKKVSLLFIG